MAYAEVGGDELARLHPAEDPGDGAKISHGFFAAALGGAGAETRMFEFGYRCGLFEVGEGVGVVDDVFAVKGVRGGGEPVERGLPDGENLAGEVRRRCTAL